MTVIEMVAEKFRCDPSEIESSAGDDPGIDRLIDPFHDHGGHHSWSSMETVEGADFSAFFFVNPDDGRKAALVADEVGSSRWFYPKGTISR